jgi:hypothetical protein
MNRNPRLSTCPYCLEGYIPGQLAIHARALGHPLCKYVRGTEPCDLPVRKGGNAGGAYRYCTRHNSAGN